MKLSLHIFLPEFQAPEIEEMKFSFEFCRRVTLEMCQDCKDVMWHYYDPERTIGEFINQIRGSGVLIITDPELAFSSLWIKRLLSLSDNPYQAIGPVYNDSQYKIQIANLQHRYHTVSTYIEICELLAQQVGHQYIETEMLDPACIWFCSSLIENIHPNVFIKDIHTQIQGKKAVDPGSFVHRFGDYYHADRVDLIELIPENVGKVLDVGCAFGGYGKKLKQLRPEIKVFGVELNPLMAASARKYYDEVFNCSIEKIQFPNKFDLINCGDIIEHLYDPWNMLKRFNNLLNTGGYLVVSVPNVGHWSIAMDLVNGRFDYIPVGLQCISHIRWFTEESLKRAIKEAGFRIDVFNRATDIPTPKGKRFMDEMKKIRIGNDESLMTHEFIVRAVKV